MRADTIAAIATAPGKGGVGIVRVSGPLVSDVMQSLLGRELPARKACFHIFKDKDGQAIDEGIALYFSAPNSYTGEDTLELQGHGGAVVLNQVLAAVTQFPHVRLARPGEFSERAFLNNKLDLAQAEAVADLIEASSEQAARSALRSLKGAFSHQVNDIVSQLTELRTYVEAAIDFPDEEIDFLSSWGVAEKLDVLQQKVSSLLKRAQSGVRITNGLSVVIAGKPNAGKSSVLNALTGEAHAIVTDIPGTTRDLLRAELLLDGIPLHVVDTAGLRDSTDPVEKEGIRRARSAIAEADNILWIVDGVDEQAIENAVAAISAQFDSPERVTIVLNKIDLIGDFPTVKEVAGLPIIYLSAKQNVGVDLLSKHLLARAGLSDLGEGAFTARQRHVDALLVAEDFVLKAIQSLNIHQAGELVAEDLRQAQLVLSEVTGQFTADDLLGKIFGEFCIGK